MRQNRNLNHHPLLPRPRLQHRTRPKHPHNLARSCNAFYATLRDAQPTHYGFFASVPNLAASPPSAVLAEIEYAFDTLRADRVMLFASYHAEYLGNPAFRPMWTALSARKVVVFVHPTPAAGGGPGPGPSQVSPLLPPPACDFPHETGRTALDLITSGRLRGEASGCKIILSHGGGALPGLIDRVAELMPFTPAGGKLGISSDEMLGFARGFYYDTALASGPVVLRGLFALLGKEGKGEGAVWDGLSGCIGGEHLLSYEAVGGGWGGGCEVS